MSASRAMQRYDAELKQKAVVLMLRHRELFEAGGELIHELGFWKDTPHLHLIMKVAVFLLVKKHTKPSHTALTSEIGAMEEDLSPTDFKNAMDILEVTYDSETFEEAKDYVLMAVNTYIHDIAVNRLKVELNPHDIGDALIKTRKTLDTISGNIFERPPIMNPFFDMESNLADSVKVPFGIDFIDEILDGGAVPGEFIGILAPTGGGKTTLALQIGNSVICQDEGWVHASTEQSMKGDLSLRMACLATGMTRKELRGGHEVVCPKAEVKLAAVKGRWLSNMRFLDLSRNVIPSIPAFFDKVDQAQHEMGSKKIRFLTIDWWGRMKDRMIRRLQNRLEEAQVRLLAREWMDELRQEALKRDITTILFHQLSGAAASKGPKHKPSSHDAQEDRNFNNLMDFCFVIGKMTAGQVCRFYADKARSTARTEQFIKLDGSHCRFVRPDRTEVPGEFERLGNVGIYDSDYL